MPKTPADALTKTPAGAFMKIQTLKESLLLSGAPVPVVGRRRRLLRVCK